MHNVIFTIGHSTHTIEHFISLLKKHSITALCDVRSAPYSRMNPQFNREFLKEQLQRESITYVFLGKELGARSEDSSCYINGKVQFDLLAKTALFHKGIDRLREGMKRFQLALMCAEKDPLECHRTILVSRYLETLQIAVQHILSDGSLESHNSTLIRLLHQLHLSEQDMFKSRHEIVEDAYKIQGERIAYDERESASGKASSTRSTYN